MLLTSLRGTLWLCSLAALGAFLWVASRRLLAPAPWDPLEGLLVDHALRLEAHGPLYVPFGSPALALMPGLPAAVALLTYVLGPSMMYPRILSVLAAVGTVLIVGRIVRYETGRRTYAAASAGLALAGSVLLGAAPGVGRPEWIALFPALAGCWQLRRGTTVASAVMAGILIAGAAMIEITTLWVAAAALVRLSFDEPRRCLALAATVGVLFGGGYVMFSLLLGPWFNFHASDALVLPLVFNAPGFAHYLGQVLLGQVGVLTLMAILSLAMPVRPWLGPAGVWFCVGVTMLGVAAVTTQHAGAGPAVAIYTITALAIIGPLSMQRVTQHLATWPGSSRLGGQGIVLVALVLQYVALASAIPAVLRG